MEMLLIHDISINIRTCDDNTVDKLSNTIVKNKHHFQQNKGLSSIIVLSLKTNHGFMVIDCRQYQWLLQREKFGGAQCLHNVHVYKIRGGSCICTCALNRLKIRGVMPPFTRIKGGSSPPAFPLAQPLSMNANSWPFL